MAAPRVSSGPDAVHKGTHFINVPDRLGLMNDVLLFLMAESIKSVPGRFVPVQLTQKILGCAWNILHHNHLTDSLPT